MKCVLVELQSVYNELKDKNEIAIIERYVTNAKRFTISITGKSILFIFITAHIE